MTLFIMNLSCLINSSVEITNQINCSSVTSSIDDDGEEDGVISAATLKAVENVIYIGLVPGLVVMGSVTNVINMAVFWRQGLGDRINVILFSLSLADFGYVVFMMASKFYTLISLFDATAGKIWKYRGLHTTLWLQTGFMNLSQTFIMLIALERCACVLAPLHAKTFLSARSTGKITAAIYVILLTLCGLFNFKYQTDVFQDPVTNKTVVVSSLSPTFLEYKGVLGGIDATLSMSIPTVSVIVVAVSTAVTVIQLRRSLAWRRETSTSQTDDKREVALTKMLIAVSIVYVICVTPYVIKNILSEFLPDFLPVGQLGNSFDAINAFTHLLNVTNSAINFLVYTSLGSRYRAVLRQLCCCPGNVGAGPHRRKDGSTSSDSVSGVVNTVESSYTGA